MRERRSRVETPGYRVREITLLDASAYPTSELAALDDRRWQVELNSRHIKIGMKMDVRRCETVEAVLKERAIFSLAHNLVRSVMLESARARELDRDRIGLLDALRWLIGTEPPALVVNPSRRGRVVKRRPKPYMRLTRPRGELRKLLPMKHF